MNICQSILLQAGKESANDEQIAGALEVASANAATSDVAKFRSLADVVIDRVAPWLCSGSTNIHLDAERHFDTFFLNGPPAPAFDSLVSGLSRSGPSSEACARTLILFTDVHLGGSKRLAAVLSTSLPFSSSSAPTLAHLPSRIANATLATSEGCVMKEPSYYRVLATALLYVCEDSGSGPRIRDANMPGPDISNSALNVCSALIGKLVVLGQAPLIVDTWCSIASTQFRGERMGAARTRSVRRTPEEALSSIVRLAPASATEALVRALVADSPFQDCSQRSLQAIGSLREKSLCVLLSTNRYALDQVVLNIPYVRPLLGTPRKSLPRLVRTIVRNGAGDAGLSTATQRWANDLFADCQDVALQCQVTRILLLYMATLKEPSDAQSSLLGKLATGVCNRIPNSQPSIQRYGMLVGEMTSRLVHDAAPLKFERKHAMQKPSDTYGDSEISDSDLSDIAQFEPSEDCDDEGNAPGMVESQELGVARSWEVSSEQRLSYATSAEAVRVSPSDVVPQQWWCDDDDWPSLGSFCMTESDQDDGDVNRSSNEGKQEPVDDDVSQPRWSAPVLERDYASVKKHVHAPMSVARILAMVRQLNSGDQALSVSPELVTSTLRTLCARAEGVGGAQDAESTLAEASEDLALAIFNTSAERFPPSFGSVITELRRRAILALAAVDLARVGGGLIETVFAHEDATYGHRIESLDLVCAGMRELAKKDEAELSSLATVRDYGEQTRVVGNVTRRLNRTLRAGEARKNLGKLLRIPRRRAPKVAEGLFYSIGYGLQTLWISGKEDCGGLAAQALVTMGVVLDAAGAACAGRDDMCATLVDAANSWRTREEAVVRRASALALGAVARAASASVARELAGLASGPVDGVTLRTNLDEGLESNSGTNPVEWLRLVANGADGDVYVRRFATISLGQWGSKLIQ